jgi:uroporphyrinogen decarboxylase
VQIFDTWGPLLSRREYQAIDQPYIEMVVEGIADLGVPVILYAGGAPHQFADASMTGVHALSVDHRTPLGDVRAMVKPGTALQGNLNPAILFAGKDRIVEETERVLLQGGKTGFVFNLGHGIWPDTPLEAVATMIETVRAL